MFEAEQATCSKLKGLHLFEKRKLFYLFYKENLRFS